MAARRHRPPAPALLAALAALACLALASAAHASSVVTGGAGKRGASLASGGTCAYRIFGTRGVLQLGVTQPIVSGPDRRRRRARERSFARYRVYVTDVANGYATVATSEWSDWLTVREGDGSWWSSPTIFELDWRGNYGADVLVEWWTSRRMIGWRTHRVTAFQYFDQFDTGPYGPMSSCAKASWDRPLPMP